MITFCFEVPKGYHRGRVMLVIILEAENLVRMERSDPFDMLLKELPGSANYSMADIDIVIAYERDSEPLKKFLRERDIAGLMGWLERGREIQPGDLGPMVPLELKLERKQ